MQHVYNDGVGVSGEFPSAILCRETDQIADGIDAALSRETDQTAVTFSTRRDRHNDHRRCKRLRDPLERVTSAHAYLRGKSTTIRVSATVPMPMFTPLRAFRRPIARARLRVDDRVAEFGEFIAREPGLELREHFGFFFFDVMLDAGGEHGDRSTKARLIDELNEVLDTLACEAVFRFGFLFGFLADAL